jgi:BirA family transcriptional regulator, biotin operon repressor / biotin---[acetyl-CoA-carboxylase] ligase
LNSFSFNAIKTLQSNTFLGLIVGENIITLQRVSSTNDYLKSNLSNSTPYSEGTVIMAEDQYAGKGQSGNIWRSEAGQNLTFSVLLNPTFLSPTEQFKLNIAVSLSILDLLQPIAGKDLFVKWPNDIYIGNKKIGGILIENIIRGKNWKHAIVGIGLNINQTYFEPNNTRAASLKSLFHKHFDLKKLLLDCCRCISLRYEELRSKSYLKQKEEYKSYLFRLNQLSPFSINGVEVEGMVIDVNDEGKLIVNFNGHITDFGIKEISFVIDKL